MGVARRLAACVLTAFAVQAQQFEAKTLATELRGGYQVVATDMNRDGRPDLLVLASGLPELVWLESPTWERHVIARDLPRMINAAPYDTDGDGIPEIAVAYRFENQAKNSVGVVAVLSHLGDPKQLWKTTEIDRLTTSHRLRWFKGLLINAPLTGAKAEQPDYRDQIPLVLYRPGAWKREVITDSLQGVMHGIFITPDSFLTASFEGIHRFRQNGSSWKKEFVAKGDPAPWPKGGSSDVTTLRSKNKTLLAAIEPWHGNQVAIYEKGKRTVIDDTLTDGHTIVAADFDRDGRDEIVAGFRGGARGVNLYRQGKKDWQRTVIDQGAISAAACIAVDLDADKLLDIVCIGSATQNLKWYRQVAQR